MGADLMGCEPMSGATMGQVTSADGTSIVFDRSGAGPVITLVHGACTGRTHPILSDLAAALAPWVPVVNYDRRGRGDRGDTQPYAAERELGDQTALLEIAGGSAMVFGGSSGAGLAPQAAPRCPDPSPNGRSPKNGGSRAERRRARSCLRGGRSRLTAEAATRRVGHEAS